MESSKVRQTSIFSGGRSPDSNDARRVLKEIRHRVVAEAGRIEEAQRLAQTADLDLALLDVNVGGHNIAPVAECLEKRGLPFLFVSGHGSDSLTEPFRGRSVLQKPFVVSKLSAAIEAILDPD
jgi:DNA-binding response OmpR family regulator